MTLLHVKIEILEYGNIKEENKILPAVHMLSVLLVLFIYSLHICLVI